MEKGTLYLIPNVLSGDTGEATIPGAVRSTLPQLEYFLTENIRTARRYISSLKLGIDISGLQFEVLDKNTTEDEVFRLLQPVLEGKDAGVISESGCPGIADPGALAVEMAHQLGIRVAPLVGPSSILLALMASGMNGQKFSFHGYLPIQEKERSAALRKLERESIKEQVTQIFIETPYRNEQMLKTMLKTLNPQTRVCIARDLTGKEEMVRTHPVSKWKKQQISLHKLPVVFLING